MNPPLSVQEVADATGMSRSWVRQNATKYGGTKAGVKCWRFPHDTPRRILGQCAPESPRSVSTTGKTGDHGTLGGVNTANPENLVPTRRVTKPKRRRINSGSSFAENFPEYAAPIR